MKISRCDDDISNGLRIENVPECARVFCALLDGTRLHCVSVYNREVCRVDHTASPQNTQQEQRDKQEQQNNFQHYIFGTYLQVYKGQFKDNITIEILQLYFTTASRK